MVELLAPAGSPEAVTAAVQSGANAVYLSFEDLTGCRRTENIPNSEFESVVRYCRIRGCRAYLALNIPVREDELNKAAGLALRAQRCGVDAIIGSHSHLVGRMETMDITTDDGKEKTCFVAYSLGNFFSSQSSSYASGCEESVILNLQFTKNGETGETALTNVSYTPLYLLDSGKDADGSRYEILPIRTAIASGLFPKETDRLTNAISRLRTRTESDFDSGK